MINTVFKQPDEALIEREEEQQIDQALHNLKEIYRLPIILKYFKYQSVEDIAEVLDLNISTVKIRLHRGRQMLGERLGNIEL